MKVQEHLWGIDMGGTKIEGVVLESAQNPQVIFKHRVPTLACEGYSVIKQQVVSLLQTMEQHMGYRPQAVGMCTPGAITPSTQCIKNSNALALNGNPLKKDLEALTGIRFEIANDANCFALAEAKLGIAKDISPKAQVVFGIIIGTGVGGGLVVNGKVINGIHGIAGEWGHNFLENGYGRDCYCGKNGCNESILSGPSLEWYYEQHTGIKKELKEIVTLAETGADQVAVQTMQRLYKYFGKAVSSIINMIDPEVIVIGGGLGNIDSLYTYGIPEILPHIFNDTLETAIVKPKLGDSAGVYGAAFLIV